MAQRNRGGRRLLAVATAAMTLVFGEAYAQAVNTFNGAPSAAFPNQFQPPPDLQAPALLDFDVSVEAPAGVRPPPEIADEVITVTQIRVEGMSVYAREDVLPFFRPVIGEDITFTRLYEVAGEVTALYRADGYALSFAFFPPQVVENGVYTLQVVEGFVDTVGVTGLEGWLAEWLEQEAQTVRWRRPFRLDQLNALVRRLNGLSGAEIQAILQPSEERERASQVVLDVSYRPYTFDAGGNNRSSDFVGPYTYSGGFTFRNLWGYGDSFDLRTTIASELEEQQSIVATVTQPLDDLSTRASLTAAYTKAEPGDNIRVTALLSTTMSLEANLEKDFYFGPDQTLTAFGGLKFLSARTTNNDGPNEDETLSNDRAWSATLGASWFDSDFLGQGGGFSAQIALGQGIPNLPGSTPGASDADDPRATPSREDARPENTTAQIDIGLLQPISFIDPNLRMNLRAQARRNRKGSFASDEYTVGGNDFGRGYDPAEIAGDAGYAASVEFSYFIPDGDWLKIALEPYAFYDFGYVYNYNQAQGGRSTLASAGAGIRAFAPDINLDFDLEFAQPLTRRVSSAPPQSGGLPFRVYFGLRYTVDDLAQHLRNLSAAFSG